MNASSITYLDPAALMRIKSLELRARVVVEGLWKQISGLVCAVVGLLSLDVLAAELPIEIAPLTRVPDLTPLLTVEEVGDVFGKWNQLVETVGPGLKPEQLALFQNARMELSAQLPKPAKITLYSLVPVPVTEASFMKVYPDRYQALLKLDRFYNCPILGSIEIENPDEVNRWMGFLNDQVTPGDLSACDFMPRHGFRLAVGDRRMDILMCFQCSQLSLPGGKDLRMKGNPVFSNVVKDLLNDLFDKNKIERDKPRKSGAAASH